MLDIIYDILLACHKTTKACQRFAEGAHYQIHFILQPEVFGCASSMLAQYSERMSVIDHDPCAVLLCQLHYGRQICNVALHTEYAVDYDEFAIFVIYFG